jgi:hypothetical protein
LDPALVVVRVTHQTLNAIAYDGSRAHWRRHDAKAMRRSFVGHERTSLLERREREYIRIGIGLGDVGDMPVELDIGPLEMLPGDPADFVSHLSAKVQTAIDFGSGPTIEQ